jgi:hypothetical protein
MEVVYAHTDSLYVPIPSVEKAQEIQEILNKHIQEKVFPNVMGLEDHPMDLEFEKYYSVLGVGATKNRNAGFINWKDGVFLTEKEFVCTGFTLKRIAESPLAKDIQKKTIEMWIGQKTKDEIVDYVRTIYHQVLNGEIEKSRLIKRGRVREKRMFVKCSGKRCGKKYNVEYLKDLLKIIPDYICEKEECTKPLKFATTLEGKNPAYGGGFAGVFYYNEHINPNDKLDDSFYYLRCDFRPDQKRVFTNWNGQTKPAKYVAVRSISELDDYEPNWKFIADADVLKKVKPVFDAMNWSLKDITKDDKQTSLDGWF